MSHPYGPPPGQHPQHAPYPSPPGGFPPPPGPASGPFPAAPPYPAPTQHGTAPAGPFTPAAPRYSAPAQYGPPGATPPPPMAAAAAQPIPPGMGRVIVDCSYTPMAFLLSATGPAVVVDGQQRGFQWGPTVVDLPPGQHHLHVHTRYMGQIGKADAPISIAPGQIVQLYYRAPLTVFNAGALGPTPQSAPGMGVMIAVIGVPIVLILLVVLIAVIA